MACEIQPVSAEFGLNHFCCLICYTDLKDPISHYGLNIFLETSQLSHSHTYLEQKLAEILNIEMKSSQVFSEYICQHCFNLVQEVDRLDEETLRLKNSLLIKFQQSSDKYLANLKEISVRIDTSKQEEGRNIPAKTEIDTEKLPSSPRFNREINSAIVADSSVLHTNLVSHPIETITDNSKVMYVNSSTSPPSAFITGFDFLKMKFVRGDLRDDPVMTSSSTTNTAQTQTLAAESGSGDVARLTFSTGSTNNSIEDNQVDSKPIFSPSSDILSESGVAVSLEETISDTLIPEPEINSADITVTSLETVTTGSILNSESSEEATSLNCIDTSLSPSSQKDDDSSQMVELTKTPDGKTKYHCIPCNKTFSRLYYLQSHYETRKHSKKREWICKKCGAAFYRHAHLVSHRLIHTGERHFDCKECGKKFLLKSDLVTHSRMHTGQKPYVCRYCMKSFSFRDCLNSHIKIHEGIKKFVCEFCAKSFVKSCDLTKHKRKHTGERPYKCTICGKGFTQSVSLKNHMKTHDENNKKSKTMKKSKDKTDTKSQVIAKGVKPIGKNQRMAVGTVAEINHDAISQTYVIENDSVLNTYNQHHDYTSKLYNEKLKKDGDKKSKNNEGVKQDKLSFSLYQSDSKLAFSSNAQLEQKLMKFFPSSCHLLKSDGIDGVADGSVFTSQVASMDSDVILGIYSKLHDYTSSMLSADTPGSSQQEFDSAFSKQFSENQYLNPLECHTTSDDITKSVYLGSDLLSEPYSLQKYLSGPPVGDSDLDLITPMQENLESGLDESRLLYSESLTTDPLELEKNY